MADDYSVDTKIRAYRKKRYPLWKMDALTAGLELGYGSEYIARLESAKDAVQARQILTEARYAD